MVLGNSKMKTNEFLNEAINLRHSKQTNPGVQDAPGYEPTPIVPDRMFRAPQNLPKNGRKMPQSWAGNMQGAKYTGDIANTLSQYGGGSMFKKASATSSPEKTAPVNTQIKARGPQGTIDIWQKTQNGWVNRRTNTLATDAQKTAIERAWLNSEQNKIIQNPVHPMPYKPRGRPRKGPTAMAETYEAFKFLVDGIKARI